MCDSLFCRREIKLAIEDCLTGSASLWNHMPILSMIHDPCTVKRFKPEAKSGSSLGFCLFVSVHLNSASKKRDGRREFTRPASSLET